jgi:hypothetical protein
VTVTADITNPSPELTAENAEVTLSLPAGVELVAGQATQAFGTLQTSARATATWTVRGTTDGLKQLTATTSATRFGSTFRSSAAAAISVDAAPPTVTLATPVGTTEQTTIPLSWGATDGTAVATFDLEVAINDGPFSPWLTRTTQTTAVYSGSAGARYRFRIRAADLLGNVSAYLVSEELTVTAPTRGPGGPPTGPPPGSNRRPSPELKITRVNRTGPRLRVRGTVALGANGKVEARWSAHARGRRRTAHASTYAQLRSFNVTIRLPPSARKAKRAVLAITYVGGRQFATQTVRKTVRSR